MMDVIFLVSRLSHFSILDFEMQHDIPRYELKPASIIVRSPGDYEKLITEIPPGVPAAFLGEQMAELLSIVQTNGGVVISKYHPPAVAVWAGNESGPDCRACEAADAIRSILRKRVQPFPAIFRRHATARIGLCHGACVLQVQDGQYTGASGDLLHRATQLHDIAGDNQEVIVDNAIARCCSEFDFDSCGGAWSMLGRRL